MLDLSQKDVHATSVNAFKGRLSGEKASSSDGLL